MSNSSNTNKFNSSRDRSFYGLTNTEGNTTKDTFLKNGSNIIMKDYSNFAIPNNSSLLGGVGNDGFNPYVMDSKIKDLESKITTLEEANKILLERINTNEKNFTVQLKQMEVNNAEERENRYKAEKEMNIISEQNNANSNDLNLKLNMLQERIVKGDETKTQQRQFDLESQKYLIGKLTEKITKTVKSEVEARYKADMDGKIFSQRLSNKFESSLDILKKEIEEITNQTRVEMQNISRECSERTHNVSKYIDQQIQDAVFGKGSSNEELKNFVRKLTEQVKNSLLSISKKHEMIEARLNNIENKDGTNQSNNKNLIDRVENRLMKKINDVKLYTEINMTKHDQFLEQNIKQMTTQIEKNISFVAAQLIETRNKINERFEKIFEENHGQYKSLCEDMEQICHRLYEYEDLLKKYEVDYNNVLDNVNKSLSDFYARGDVQIVHERILKTIECNFLQEQINNIYTALQSNNLQFKENLNELNKGSKNSVDFLQAKINEQENKLLEMGINNLNMFEENKKTLDSIEVAQIVKEMITRIDNQLVIESIQSSKQTENDIMRTIQEHKNEIMNSINEINTNKEEITNLKDKVNIIEGSLDTSGQKMLEMKERMQKMKKESEELEMKESVNKIMDLMITNIDNILTKERMDKMSEFDLNKMRATIIDLEDKYNSLSNTNTELESIKENINQLTAEQEILKNKPKGGDDIKLATIQMLNNVEFDNIYSILNSGDIGANKEQVNMKDYSEMVDNKINNAMEKIKNDNEETWIKCVQMKDKVTDPEEIRRILREVPAGIYSKEDSQKKIFEVSNEEENYALAKTNFDVLKNKNYAKDIDNYNYNNQQDPGPDINSKKSSKKSSKKGKKENSNNVNNQIDNANANIEENKSKKSKGTNKNKKAEQIEAAEEKQSKKSKAMSQNKKSEKSKNEENKTNKSQAKNIQESVNDENKSKKSSKNKKVEVQNDEGNQNPVEEPNEENKENLQPDENEENEEGEEEEDDVEGNENEEYGGQMNSTNRVSGKTPPNIKKK